MVQWHRIATRAGELLVHRPVRNQIGICCGTSGRSMMLLVVTDWPYRAVVGGGNCIL